MSRSEDGTPGGVTRRGFLGAAAGTLSAGVITGGARGHAAPAASGAPAGGREAMGDLAHRIAATAGRLTGAGIPAFTEEFVIADVTLDPGRRFTNYSGDLSGRYIEALSVLPPAGRSPADLAPLVARLRRAQQPDGRFGRSDLRFTPAEIGTDHMPLLWGNGRLLVGLMAYAQATGDRDALAAARKLGDFLLGVQSATGSREVVERVELAGAAGFICFTQLNEGLMLLWQATRDERCLVAARETMRLLRPRGVQHSHGYLTTLRGALMLHEATRDAAIRDEVERAFGDLTGSADYLVDGGTHEFFGWHDPANTQALGSLRKGPDDFGRNEGCSLGDLVRLALHLHRATGKVTYLEAAERCYLNAFSHNQFASGDFGHRSYFERGFRPVPNLARSWWCCTMHGYRCFADVLDAAVAVDGGGIRIDLFEDLRVGGTVALRTAATGFGVTVTFDRPFEGTLAVRVPGWAASARLLRNGSPLAVSPDAGYLRLAGRFMADEVVELAVTPRVWIRSQANRDVAHDAVSPEPLEGALMAGPYLMTVAEEDAPDFFGEPWTGGDGGQAHGNVIRLDASVSERLGTGRWPRLTTAYDHGGFRGRHPLVLRALGARPAGDQQIHAFWLPYARG